MSISPNYISENVLYGQNVSDFGRTANQTASGRGAVTDPRAPSGGVGDLDYGHIIMAATSTDYSAHHSPGNQTFAAIATVLWGAENSVVAASAMAADHQRPANGLTDGTESELEVEYIFDRMDVRVVFITLYSIVFACCFFGNLLVILVVTLSRRLRSTTNFFLANLAVADLCVGVFCVMQNLSIYLITSWVFGDFLCKMYQFVQSMSYTASVFILVVICMERYFAIIHPITCKQILTSNRLRMIIIGVWITAALYSIPKFLFVHTVDNILGINGRVESICIINRKMYNSKVFDLINFGILYLIPLFVISILYSRIALALWRSSCGLERHIALQNTTMMSNGGGGYSQNMYSAASFQAPASATATTAAAPPPHPPQTGTAPGMIQMEGGGLQTTAFHNNNSFYKRTMGQAGKLERYRLKTGHSQAKNGIMGRTQASVRYQRPQLTQISQSAANVLRARRGVIRMLIVVVLTFALCNLPFHARKMWQYWSPHYEGASDFNAMFTPLTFLLSYFNSGVNPILYAFLSRNFRKGMREILFCSLKKPWVHSSSKQRLPTQDVVPAATTELISSNEERTTQLHFELMEQQRQQQQKHSSSEQQNSRNWRKSVVNRRSFFQMSEGETGANSRTSF